MVLNNIEKELISYINSQQSPVDIKKISKDFNVNTKILKNVLNKLVHTGQIVLLKSGKYSSTNNLNLYTGYVDGHPDGYAFFIADDKIISDLYIPPNKLNGAIHGDRVAVRVEEYNGKDEAYVAKIIERRYTRIVGRVEKSKHFAYVIPFMKKFFYDIYIPGSSAANLEDQEIVVCQIIKFPEKRKNPEGSIIKRLGFINDEGIDNKIILEKYELKKSFPASVIKETKTLDKIFENKFEDRKDLRDIFTVTIDGEDAKDFDDAISIVMSGDNTILYVHIADVSHFVQPFSSIDKEAYNRGTSVYFPEFAIPMLPEKLSNDLCSLKPNEDRFAITAEIVYDNNLKRQNVKFYQSIINSNYRLTYNYVSDLLEKKISCEDKNLINLLENAEELTLKLTNKKKSSGMIDFDLPEPEFIFDEKGNLVGIKPLERKISHRIIENFMIEANEVVSEFLESKKESSIFRVHGEPERMKIREFINLCKEFGISIEDPEIINPKVVQKISETILASSYSYILSSLLVRSMQKALYSTNNIGHFGLASKSYTHFTSPIRRYPDLIIHRSLKKYLFGYNFDVDSKWLEEAAKHSSERQELAENAERDIHQFKKIRFLEKKPETVYQGYINRVKSSGIFVFIESLLLTGFVSLSKLEDDYYSFDSQSSILYGKNKGKRYRVGDMVGVIVDRINYDFLEVDFYISSLEKK
jgi:ribonuclease R